MSDSFFGELRRRRLLQIVGIFLGAAWVGVEFTDWIVTRYALNSHIVDKVLAGALSMTPAVAIVAWFHGAPGRDAWHPMERVAIPVNALAAAALVASIGGGGEVQASVKTVTATDEDGQEIVRQVVEQSQKRGLALFFLNNQSGDESLDWLQYGASIALGKDLQQNPFFSIATAYSGWEQYGFFMMRKAGYPEGLNLPTALQRDIAERWGKQYFLSGTFNHVEGEYRIDLDLFETESGRKRNTFTVSGDNVMSLTDELTQLIVGQLGLPDPASIGLPDDGVAIQDLPVAERLTESMEAFRQFVLGRNEVHLRNETEQSYAYYSRAVEIDPSFALANVELGSKLFNSGRTLDGAMAVQSALQHEYRLLDQDAFLAKALNYVFRGQRDKEVAVYRMWAELAPYNPAAHANLGFAQLYASNDVASALDSFKKVYEVDPSEHWALAKIAELHEVLGEPATAREYYERAIQARPDDHSIALALGRLKRREGDLAGARQDFERASILATSYVDPVLSVANLDIREGHYEQAEQRLNDAQNIATTPRQDAAVLRERLNLLSVTGQETAFLKTLEQLDASEKEFRTPINRIMGVWIDNIGHFARAGRTEEGVRKLQALELELEAPMNSLLQIGHLVLRLTTGEADKAEQHGQQVEAFMQGFKRDDMLYAVAYSKARIEYQRGNLADALTYMEKAYEMYDGSVQSLEDEKEGFDILTRMGAFYIESDRLDDAQRVLEQVTSKYPAHPEANFELTRLFAARGDQAGAQARLDIVNAAMRNADATNPLKQQLANFTM